MTDKKSVEVSPQRLLLQQEFASCLATLLICEHNNPSSDAALRVCAQRLARLRVTSPKMKEILTALSRDNRICEWLDSTLDNIQSEGMSTLTFLTHCGTTTE